MKLWFKVFLFISAATLFALSTTFASAASTSICVSDSFGGPSGTNLTSHITTTGSQQWIQGAKNDFLQIATNPFFLDGSGDAVYPGLPFGSSTNPPQNIVIVNASAGSATATVTTNLKGGPYGDGLVYAYKDSQNFYVFQLVNGIFRAWEANSNVNTGWVGNAPIKSVSLGINMNIDYTIQVSTNNGQINAYLYEGDNVLPGPLAQLSFPIDPQLAGNTKYGLVAVNGSSPIFKNFSVTSNSCFSSTSEITITENTNPTSDTGSFNLNIDNQTYSTGSFNGTTNTGTTGPVTINTGAHTINEVAGGSTNLANYNIAAICTLNGGNPMAVALPTQVTLSAGDNEVCTITNIRLGYLKIVKNAVGSDGTFSFTASRLVGSPPIINEVDFQGSIATVGGTNSVTTPGLIPATYTLTEGTTAGWTQTSATCDNGNPSAVNIVAGQITTCTFTNSTGSLTITKNITGATGGTFTFTIIPPTPLASISKTITISNGTSGSVTVNNLTAGTYSVIETTNSQWQQTNATCSNGTPSATTMSSTPTTCTFTDAKLPTLIVNISTIPSSNAGSFNVLINGTPYANNISNGGTTGTVILSNTGTFTISETGGTGTSMNSYTTTFSGACTANGTVILNAGDNKTCTITNTYVTPLSGIWCNQVFTSSGTDWTPRGTPNPIVNWQTIAYGQNPAGQGILVALAGGQSSMISYDNGVTWQFNPITGTNSTWTYSSLTYGNGWFVATVQYTGYIITSQDGVNWNVVTLPAAIFNSNAWWTKIIYANGKFVALTQTGNTIMTSSDPNNSSSWNLATIPSSLWNQGYDIAYGNGTFVIVGRGVVPYGTGDYSGGNYAIYSSDGITWYAGNTLRIPNDLTNPLTWTSVAYGSGIFVASGRDQNSNAYIMTSSNGAQWQLQGVAGGAYAVLTNLTYGNGMFVGLNNYTLRGDIRFAFANNLTNWTPVTAISLPLSYYIGNYYIHAITYGNGTFATVSLNGSCGNSLNISKNTVGGNNSFNFSIANATQTPFSPNNITISSYNNYGNYSGGTTISNLPLYDSYAVSETNLPPGWIQDSATCFYGTNLSSSTQTFTPDSVPIYPGIPATCKFINSYHAGTLVITKNTIGGDGSFRFDATNPLLTAYDNSTVTVPTTNGTGTKSLSLGAGTYSVNETVPSGWTKTDDSCSSAPIVITAGQTTTCSVTDIKNPTITIKKIIIPSSDFGKFNLQLDGSIAGTGANVGSGGATGTIITTVGAHTVGETSVFPTDLNNYTTTISCTINGNVPVTSGGGSITLKAGDVEVCTITNTRKPTLTINKIVVLSSDTGKFNLQIDNATAGTGANVGNGGTTGAITENIGTYKVGETAGTDQATGVVTNLSNYKVSFSGACTDNGDGTASSTLIAGQNAICTITNKRNATLTVNKVCNPTIDPGHFNLQIDQVTEGTGANVGCTTAGGETSTTGPVTVTTGVLHTVGETGGTDQATGMVTNLANYTKTFSGDCDVSGKITLTAGQNAVCTITNTATGSLTITKTTTGGDDTFTFNVFPTPTVATVTTSGGTGSDTIPLPPGTYSVSETNLPTGWTEDPGSCTSVTVEPGQTATCAVANTFTPPITTGSLTIIKTTTAGSGDGPFNFSIVQIPLVPTSKTITTTGNTATTAGTGSVTIPNLAPGSYMVSETTLPTGWTEIPSSCSSKTVVAGQTTTCVVTDQKNTTTASHCDTTNHTCSTTGTGAVCTFDSQCATTSTSHCDTTNPQNPVCSPTGTGAVCTSDAQCTVPVCGNGICDGNETGASCPQDCITLPTCIPPTTAYINIIKIDPNVGSPGYKFAGHGVNFYRGKKFVALQAQDIGQELIIDKNNPPISLNPLVNYMSYTGPNDSLTKIGLTQTKSAGTDTLENVKGNFLTINYLVNENTSNQTCYLSTDAIDITQSEPYGYMENGTYIFPIVP